MKKEIQLKYKSNDTGKKLLSYNYAKIIFNIIRIKDVLWDQTMVITLEKKVK